MDISQLQQLDDILYLYFRTQSEEQNPELGGILYLFGDQDQDTTRRRKRWWNRLGDKCCGLSALCTSEDPEQKRKALVKKDGGYR